MAKNRGRIEKRTHLPTSRARNLASPRSRTRYELQIEARSLLSIETNQLCRKDRDESEKIRILKESYMFTKKKKKKSGASQKRYLWTRLGTALLHWRRRRTLWSITREKSYQKNHKRDQSLSLSPQALRTPGSAAFQRYHAIFRVFYDNLSHTKRFSRWNALPNVFFG